MYFAWCMDASKYYNYSNTYTRTHTRTIRTCVQRHTRNIAPPQGTNKNEMLQVLYEQWVQAGGQWETSQLVVQARSTIKGSKTGARRWMLRADIVKKYGCEVTADELIHAKESDPALRRTQVRDHPELPKRADLRLYLCWDESFETDTEDVLISKMLEVSRKDSHGRGRSKDRKKKDKRKRRRRSTSSSKSSPSSSSSQSSKSSQDSDSLSSKSRKAGTKVTKKSKKSKKGKKEGKSKRESSPSGATRLSKAAIQKAEKDRKKAEEQAEKKRQKEEEQAEKKRQKDQENEKKKAEKEQKQQVEKDKQKVRASGKKARDMGLGPYSTWM